MLVRPELSHVRKLVEVGRKNVAESRWAETLKFDEEFAHNYFVNIIKNSECYIKALVIEEQVHGYIIGAPFHHPWSGELFFGIAVMYVDECCRGGKWALKMMDDAMEYAEQKGYFEVVIGDSGFQPEKTAKLFERKGFEYLGNQYVKKIN